MKAKDLRNSILQMAVQGKLVPQDPNDEPASVLLERIRAERAKLIKEKKIKAPKGGESVIYRASDGSHYEKRDKGEPVCIDDEIPFEIPESWEWVRLDDIGDWKAGATPAKGEYKYYKDGTIPWLLTGDLTDGLVTDIPTKITERALHECSVRLNPVGSVLVAMYGATIGKIGVLGIAATTNQACCACILHDESIREWLVTWLRYQKPHFIKMGEGGAQPNISRQKIVRCLFPLPPLEEQWRIEALIAELLPFVDEYGTLEDARERLDAELPNRLRKSVLQLAVQGKLVPQDRNDEPASVLLERIRAERAKLVKEKKIKAPKGGEPVIYRASDGGYYEKRGKGEPRPIEVPFDVPDTWEWVRLKALGEIVGGGTPKTHDTSLWATSDEGVPWITPADMKNVNGRRVSHGERYLSEKGLAGSSAQLMPAGTVVMSSRAPIGYLAIAECPIATNQGFKSVVPTLVDTNVWIMLSLDALMDDIKKRASGTTFKEISGSEFGETLIPLPPLPEQACIIDCSVRTIAAIG